MNYLIKLLKLLRKPSLRALLIFKLGGLLLILAVSCTSSKEIRARLDNYENNSFLVKGSGDKGGYYLGDRVLSGRHKQTTFHIFSQRRLYDYFWNNTKNLDIEKKSQLWKEYSYNKIGKNFYTNIIINSTIEKFDQEYLQIVTKQLSYLEKENNSTRVINFAYILENNLDLRLRKTINSFKNFSRELFVVITFVGPTSAQSYYLDEQKQRKVFILNVENLLQSWEEKSEIPLYKLGEN